MVVAREPGRLQVLGTGFDPFHRPFNRKRRDNSANVSGIEGDFVTKTAADVWRNHTDVLFRDAAHNGKECAVGMRRLRGEIDGKAFGGGVEVGYATAGFERGWMTTLENRMHVGFDFSLSKDFVGGGFVTYLPVKDVVVLLFAILAQDGCAGIKR